MEGKDGLEGEADLTTDGTNLGGWGGIGGHVTLISRGAAWLNNPHVQSEVTSTAYDAASVNVTVEVESVRASAAAAAAASALSLSVTYVDKQTNRTLGSIKAACASAAAADATATTTTCSTPNLALTAPPLWSPRTPLNQLIAIIDLVADSSEAGTTSATSAPVVLDTVTVMFGIKQLVVADGYHWKMNGVYVRLCYDCML